MGSQRLGQDLVIEKQQQNVTRKKKNMAMYLLYKHTLDSFMLLSKLWILPTCSQEGDTKRMISHIQVSPLGGIRRPVVVQTLPG